MFLVVFMTAFFTLRANQKARKKEVITSYLIDAYQLLSDASNRNPTPLGIEKAISDIQLFGTEEQRTLTKRILASFKGDEKERPPIDALLHLLRRDLRAELGLPAIDKDNPILHLRMQR